MPNPTPITLGSIYHDGNRWLRVEDETDGRYLCRVIAKQAYDRITVPDTTSRVSAARLRSMTRVDAAPAPSGPAFDVIEIDQQAETITVDGTRMPYHVAASGPRVKHASDTKDGAFHVTVTFTAARVQYADCTRWTPEQVAAAQRVTDAHAIVTDHRNNEPADDGENWSAWNDSFQAAWNERAAADQAYAVLFTPGRVPDAREVLGE